METDALYWDPYDARFVDDPWPVFNRIREEAPLYYNRSTTSTRSAGTRTSNGR